MGMTELTQFSWDIIRSEYERGRPAGRLCEHYGVARSTFYARANAEGWRKPGAPPLDGYVDTPPPTPPPTHEMARTALAHAAQAMAQGRLAEAERWSRLVRRFRDLAMEEHRAGEWITAVQRGESKARALEGVQPVDTCPAGEAGLNPCEDEETFEGLDTLDCPEDEDESSPDPLTADPLTADRFAALRARVAAAARAKGLTEPDWSLLTEDDLPPALREGDWEKDAEEEGDP